MVFITHAISLIVNNPIITKTTELVLKSTANSKIKIPTIIRKSKINYD